MIEARQPVRWYHDLCSCLHSTIGGVLGAYGYDPVLTLGAAWRFERVREWEPVEFAWPAHNGDLARTLVPHDDVTLVWRESTSDEAAEREMLTRLSHGHPIIVAVDNYHLPFRPAWQDVHAGHLIVVYGYDDAAGVCFVHDAVPPEYNGPLPAEQLRVSRSSGNPNAADPFFAGVPIRRRWLEVTPQSRAKPMDRRRLATIMETNLAHFHGGSETTPAGLPAARDYFDQLSDRAASSGTDALCEAYAFGWIPQASAALHADFLAQSGIALRLPDLREAARAVEQVAHAWTPVRVGAAHGINAPTRAVHYLRAKTRTLLRHYETALEMVEAALGRLKVV